MNEKNLVTNRESIEAWRDMKFGMFIHWGLFSLVGRGEWAMFHEQVPIEEYKKVADGFTGEKFNAQEWAALAKEAGMKYMVLTAKHHDGFCLWDSKSNLDDFTSMNCPAKKDFIKEYTDACRDAGLKTGIYYSPLDWRFPGYFVPGLFAKNAKQLRDQAHSQVRELLTNYGKIDIIWYDGGEDYYLCHGIDIVQGKRPDNYRKDVRYPGFWKAEEMDKMIRDLQPGIISNERFGAHDIFGDYTSPEKKIGVYDTYHPWETCDTITEGTWGYCPGHPVRSFRECIQLLVNVVLAGGNLLLNIGPRGDGSIEPLQIQRLREMGKWLEAYGESIYKTRGGPIKCENWGGTTHVDNTMYVHVCNWRENDIIIPDAGDPTITCLTGSQFSVRKHNGKIFLSVPDEFKQNPDTIFKVEYKQKVREIFKEEIDYSTLVPKAGEFSEAFIEADF